MHCFSLNLEHDAMAYLKQLGVDGGGVSILSKKMKHLCIAIESLHVGAANILKQDALSIGADVAVPKGTVTAAVPRVNVLLIATVKQLEQLIIKERAQPFGLKEVAKALMRFVPKPLKASKIMGIINANDDSFYAKSRFHTKEALQKIVQMIDDGAHAIDIGAVSSRPGASSVSEEEELQRVKEIISLVGSEKLYLQAQFSIDSYSPRVVRLACEHGFSMINDITALSNDEIGVIAAEFGATLILMHMQGEPQSMQHNPFYENVLNEVGTFLSQRIAKAQALGVSSIIADVGIGFGKRLEDNIALLKHCKNFHQLGVELLIGASRKSMIDYIVPTPVDERLPATIAIACAMQAQGVQWLRVHDVKAHTQALAVYRQIM